MLPAGSYLVWEGDLDGDSCRGIAGVDVEESRAGFFLFYLFLFYFIYIQLCMK